MDTVEIGLPLPRLGFGRHDAEGVSASKGGLLDDIGNTRMYRLEHTRVAGQATLMITVIYNFSQRYMEFRETWCWSGSDPSSSRTLESVLKVEYPHQTAIGLDFNLRHQS